MTQYTEDANPLTPPHQPSAKELAYYEQLGREVLLAKLLNQKVWLTWVLMGSIILMWLGAVSYGKFYLVDVVGFQSVIVSNEQLTFYTGMKLNEHINAGQWWRIISSMFVHMDAMHIVFNAYGLYVLGPLIERFYGRTRMVVLYFGTGIIASLASYMMSTTPSGGASGAIYGLVGAMLVFGYKYRNDLPMRVSKALTSGMLPWVVFGIGIGFVGTLRMDNAAHIGGLASGAFMALVMRAHLNPDRYLRWTDQALRGVAALAVCTALIAAFFWGKELKGCTFNQTSYMQCYPKIALEITDPKAAIERFKALKQSGSTKK